MRRLLVSAVIAASLTVTGMAVADEPVAPTYAPEKPAAPVVEAVAKPAAPVVEAAAKPAAAVVAAPAKPAAPSVPVVAAAAPVTAKTSAISVAAAPAPPSAPAPAKDSAAPAKDVTSAPSAASVAVVAAPAPEPPLALRTPTPLALASEPAPTPWIYKVGFGAALLAAGVILWRRRRNVAGKRTAATAIRVLGKTAMGLRGELALVEVGGMRLVVGITSGSMQTLAILPDDYVLEDAAIDAETTRAMERTSSAANDAGKPRLDLASRARSLFASIDLGPPDPLRVGGASAFSASRYGSDIAMDDAPDSAPAPRTRPRDARDATPARDDRQRRVASRDVPLEGQARGIALALRTRR